MIACLATVALALAQQPAPAWSIARVELEGPLEELTLTSDASESRAIVALAPGERRELLVPALTRTSDLAPELTARGGGSARFSRWDAGARAANAAWWDGLPASLRARPWPTALAPPNRAQSLSALTWLLTASTLALAIALRRRVVLCAGVVLALSAGVYASVAWSPADPRRIRVLENDGGEAWFAVDVQDRELRVEIGIVQRIWTERPAATAQIELETGAAHAWVRSRARVWRALSLDPAGRDLSLAANRWGDFTRTWLRESDGAWSARGAWLVGERLPGAPAAEPSDPPGWIQPALPLGQRLFVGELAHGAYTGADDASDACWVRIAGFPDH